MNTTRFWVRAKDIYDLHHGKHAYDLITPDEDEQTVTGFITDMTALFEKHYRDKVNQKQEGEK